MTKEELMKKPLNYMTKELFNEVEMKWVEEYAKLHNYDMIDVFQCFDSAFYESQEDLVYQMKNELDLVDDISVTFIQRKMKVSFNKACELMNKFIEDGLVDTKENNYKILKKQQLKNEFLKK